MSFGKLNTPIQILKPTYGKDDDGFATVTEEIIACVRAYKEDRNTTEKWMNRAVLKDASALFRFRYIPNTPITEDMIIACYSGRYIITSVENVRNRKMYYEVAAKLEVPDRGNDESENAR